MYAYVWEFQARPEADDAFRRLYGPEGDWVALFRRASGYVGTRLLCDPDRRFHYVTVDAWESAEAHRAFRASFAAEFAALDRRGEALTARETFLGEFDVAPHDG